MTAITRAQPLTRRVWRELAGRSARTAFPLTGLVMVAGAWPYAPALIAGGLMAAAALVIGVLW
jgi:hypothetical protein